jgi:hypothetical protein
MSSSSECSIAYSCDRDQALDGETLSPTGMQVDGDEYVVEPQEGEPDDVAIMYVFNTLKEIGWRY